MLPAGDADMTAAAVRAANRLTARWARLCAGESTVLSGAGVWPLLALLAESADGPARSELEAAIGLAADGAAAHARGLLASLADSPSTRTALGVWTRAEVPLTSWWEASVPADVRGRLTGRATTDQAALDSWASEQTAGLIDRFPLQVNDATLLVLASALMVLTTWVEPFDDIPLRLTEGPWTRPAAAAGLHLETPHTDLVAVVDTPTGHLTMLTVRGAEDVDVHLVLGELERAAGEVLAAGVQVLAEGPGRLLGSRLRDHKPGPGLVVEKQLQYDRKPRLNVTTVRFTVEADHDLLRQAQHFGLVSASDDTQGHFPRLSSRPLAVSEARQGATATFSDKGFRAAAVTSFGMRAGAALRHRVRNVTVTFDRPFGFVAVHRPTGLVLVAGWVADPEDFVAPDFPS